MDPMNEFDVRDAFDAMDHEKMGRISIESFRIIYLGLGYPRSGYGNLREEVSKMQDNVDDGISFMTVKTILTKFPRDRNQEISKDFSLIDRNGDGSICSEDILLLSEEAGDKTSLSIADAMAHHASKKGEISPSTFAELFQPFQIQR